MNCFATFDLPRMLYGCLRDVGGGDPEQNNGVDPAQMIDENVSDLMKTVVVPAQM